MTKYFIISCSFYITILFSENYSIEIDASSYSSWVYYNFTIHSEVMISDPENSLGWDIAFQRNHIKTNSGTSGSGLGGASVDSLNIWTADQFNDLSEVPINTEFIQDTLLQTFYDLSTHTMSWGSTSPALETWGEFDYDNNYTLEPTNNQLIVITADGENYIKIWPYSYYNDVGSSGRISVLYNNDIDCTYGLDYCGVCGGNNDTCLLDGDVNQDSSINVLDIIALLDAILSNQLDSEDFDVLDINQDLNIDILDVVLLVNLVLNAD